MKLVVVFICETCSQRNKQYLGDEGYNVVDTRFTTLTEALQHIKDNEYQFQHDIYAEIEQGD